MRPAIVCSGATGNTAALAERRCLGFRRDKGTRGEADLRALAAWAAQTRQRGGEPCHRSQSGPWRPR